jgi:hypothetical protein
VSKLAPNPEAILVSGKGWGGPCLRGHVNEGGQTLRYLRRKPSGELEAGNCVQCNADQRPRRAQGRRERYATDPEYAEQERARARSRASRLTASGYTRARVKGLTVEQVEAMYEQQESACAVCRTPEPANAKGPTRLHIDHDHTCCPGDRACGTCVRGLLCQPCNQALGQLADDPVRIRALADYIEQYVTMTTKADT